ncbi:MAG: hypothetical protein OEZ01_03435 [Candidatus Heimdallarchaeota archaeon]|nr:hypothetical protein [Candidatus Heimdallarchaeota archaeon]MDH5645030.1 hypothetical protein [Candidatus Heimdallarchaeota archaeon]
MLIQFKFQVEIIMFNIFYVKISIAMVREEIISWLKDNPSTAVDLSKQFNRSQIGIEEDLDHIRTSIRDNPSIILAIRPAMCLMCEYIFSTDRTKAPTKCPECHAEKIRLPSFVIQDK